MRSFPFRAVLRPSIMAALPRVPFPSNTRRGSPEGTKARGVPFRSIPNQVTAYPKPSSRLQDSRGSGISFSRGDEKLPEGLADLNGARLQRPSCMDLGRLGGVRISQEEACQD